MQTNEPIDTIDAEPPYIQIPFQEYELLCMYKNIVKQVFALPEVRILIKDAQK